METPGSAHRRSARLKRKPFSDLTNTPSSLSSLNPKPVTRSVTGPEPSDPDPDPDPSTPETDFCDIDDTHDELRISTVYTRVKARRKLKRKVVKAAPSISCPPALKSRSIEGSMSLMGNDADLSKSFSVPPDKKRKLYEVPKPVQKSVLPEDFVQKQKAYFAEVDAFALPEEEVSDSDDNAAAGKVDQ